MLVVERRRHTGNTLTLDAVTRAAKLAIYFGSGLNTAPGEGALELLLTIGFVDANVDDGTDGNQYGK